MPELPASYRVEPGIEFADRLESVLVQRFTAPASLNATELRRLPTESQIDTTPMTGWTSEDDALIDLEPMVAARRSAHRRLATTIALGAAAATVLVVGLTVLVRIEEDPDPADVPSSTLQAPPTTLQAPPTTQQAPPTTSAVAPAVPSSPFEGIWNRDGSSVTMVITRSGKDFEVVERDDLAGVCSGASSIMTGVGQLDTEGMLVFTQLVLTCDDGTTLEATDEGFLDEGLLPYLAFGYDSQDDILHSSLGGSWQRSDSAAPLPTTPKIPIWPQSNIDELRRTQELADAGDPAYTWQVDPLLTSRSQGSDPLLTDPELFGYLRTPGTQIVERFLREELGWDEFLFSGEASVLNDELRGLVYVRCAPGETNPLYPNAPDALPEEPRSEPCAPTIDKMRYEAVTLDLSQPDRRGPDGIWVVSRWTTTRFAQSDPSVVEDRARARLEQWLQARVEGEGAEGYVEVFYMFGGQDAPLLYTTTSGSPYERFEIERVGQPQWPNGDMNFTVRLFAEGGETVVEQPIHLITEGSGRQTLRHVAIDTKENGEPLPEP